MPWPALVPALLPYYPKGDEMGFVNEVIQDQDRHLVDLQRLYDPNGHATFEPTEWCIDHERNAVFTDVPRIGRYGPGLPDQFALVLPGAVIWAYLFHKTEPGNPKKVTWTLDHLTYGEHVTLSRDEILALVKEALRPYTLRWMKAPWVVTEEPMNIEYRF
jgi:hypothetical protein